MTDQEPHPFYVELPDVPVPILSDVALCGSSFIDSLRYAQDPSENVSVIQDSRTIHKIAYGLRTCRSSYDHLMNYGMNKRLLDEGKVTREAMHNALSGFRESVCYEKVIWAEVVDFFPEKRIKGFKMPEDNDAVLYRNVNLSGGKIDPGTAERIPISVQKFHGAVVGELKNTLGIIPVMHSVLFSGVQLESGFENSPVDFQILSYLEESSAGLSVLRWDFGRRLLEWSGMPTDKSDIRGVLLGSKLSADELIKNFHC